MNNTRINAALCIPILVASHAAHAAFLTDRLVTGTGVPTVYAAFAADSDDKLYVVQQTGAIKLYDLSQPNPTSSDFLALTIDNTPEGAKFAHQDLSEAGLLGLAFHPDFANNGHLYINSTRYESGTSGQIYTDVTRYTVDNTGVAGAPATVLRAHRPPGVTSTNHNAGWLAFGADGFLYINTGDGGNSSGTAQDLNSNLGKVLRVDVNGDDFASDPLRNYAIPPGNPYAGATPGNDEIWVSGLRNPFRAGFDSATGTLFIGDVGAASREELNDASAGGLNFGWNVCEGACATSDFTDPIFEYDTGGPMGRSIVGGPVYRGAITDAELQGKVIFSDFFGGGEVWSVGPDGTGFTNLTDLGLIQLQSGWSIGAISGFFEDGLGDLYIVDYDGDIFRLAPVPLPDALLLLASGLVALFGLAHRHRHSG